jgi:hypothetical protein
MARPRPEDIAAQAAQLRRFRRLAVAAIVRSAFFGGIVGAILCFVLFRRAAGVPVLLAVGFAGGFVIVGLLTTPSWVMGYFNLKNAPPDALRRPRSM